MPAVFLLLSGLIAGVPPKSGEIERGVAVGGYAVDGASSDQVAAMLTERFDAYMEEPIVIAVGDQQAEVAPRDLGVSFDVEATYDRALQVGRGGFFGAGAERFQAHTFGVNVDPVIVFDSERFQATLEALGGGDLVPPVDARFVLSGTTMTVSESSAGTGIDAEAAAEALVNTVLGLSHGPVEVEIVPVEPRVSTAQLTSVGDQANAVLAEPMLVTDGEQYWQITPAALVEMLTYEDGKLAVNDLALASLLATLSANINQTGQDAELVFNEGAFEIAAGDKTRELDVSASATVVERELLAGKHQATLVITEESPTVAAGTLQPLLDRVNAIAERGMKVWWSDGEQELDRAAFASAIRVDPKTGEITLDHATLFSLLEPIAHGINRPATGYRWKDWVVVSADGALPGRLVDIDASVTKMIANALGGNPVTELVVQAQEDPVAAADGIVITDLLGSASTYYGSSGTNRRTNVELAASSLDGFLVAPGGTFSFNSAIGGTATLDDGYQMGFGIVAGEDGNARTVPSVAGGICQVATTVFQSAFWAGMPIGQRNWHLYWIPNYGNGPGGMVGLDATVDPDYGLDFTFQNPTDSWVAINAVADGEWITVEVWGTSQGWDVRADAPVIENVVKADQTMHREQSDELEPGEEIVVERAEDGFTATIHRIIRKGDELVREDWFTSYYQPSRNVTLVGPGGSLQPTPDPTSVPEPEPTPVIEPEPEPEPEPTPVVEETETPVTDETPVVEEIPTVEESAPDG